LIAPPSLVVMLQRLKPEPIAWSSVRCGNRSPARFSIVNVCSSVRVGTGSKAVELVTVQPQGKKPMAAPDWARGVRLTDEDRLGPAA